jgi:hypothetical protein
MGRAEELFARIEANGVAAIDQLILDVAAEELFLDFKMSADGGVSRSLQADDSKNLAKGISGFGNAEGGVIVWGVDCRRDANGRPVVQHAPLNNAAAFRTHIEETISRVTVPHHQLVQNCTVVQAGSPAGFVATLIPKADFAPIRASGGIDRYFVRAGDSFVPIGHDALAGLFGRRPRPIIWPQFVSRPCFIRKLLTVSAGSPPKETAHTTAELGLALYNKGPTLANRPYVSVHPLTPFARKVLSVEPFGGEGFDLRRSKLGNVQVIAKDGIVVAPGGLQDLCRIYITYQPPTSGEFRAEVTIGTESSGFERFELFCNPVELENAHNAANRGFGPDSGALLHVSSSFPQIV